MTLTLTLVRHGQTHYNSRQLLQGSCDSPLTRVGREGVRRTARHLAGVPFVAAYSSPSGRAVTTAVEILRHHPDVRLHTDPDLREYDFGHFERRPERDLEAVEPWAELVPAVLAGVHPGLPGGEPACDYMERVRRAFTTIVERHPAGDVLVVGHGLTLGAWLAAATVPADGEPDGRGASRGLVALPNASVSVVRVMPDGTACADSIGVDIAGAGLVAARPVPAEAPALA